jgi:hypothetical protein
MASREEEKRRRREERLAAEKKIADAAARKKRLGLAGGAVLGLAAIAAVIFAVITLAGGGSKNNGPTRVGSPTSASGPKVPIPDQKISDLNAAATAAGCVLKNPPDEGNTHVTTAVHYKSNPPTSGNHNPEPAQDGIYATGNQPAIEHLVHTLEHGRIEYEYKPGTPARRISQLTTLYNEKDGYHQLIFQNPTKMPYAVAAAAWDHYVGCPTFNDKVFDALRAFRDRYTDKAPEFFP